ncbi:MAG TPA: hypothetical protein DCL54_14940 [Alphaproteobacteria bacterium]|nr:hypothetical protein [Alphaproteobacteria bacterium]HAJ47868.1 hypothetical protein [Alphaproteobacteria bacterium]
MKQIIFGRATLISLCAAALSWPAHAELTYESFQGKFFDTAVKRMETTPAAVTDPRTIGFAGQGYVVGSQLWDGIPSADIESYMNSILEKLLSHWPGAKPGMRVRLTANPGFEAEAAPTGTLLIARGMVKDMESEDELAAVIAHEASHVLLNHFARQQEQERKVRFTADAAAIGVTAAYVSGMSVRSSSTSGVQIAMTDQGETGEKMLKVMLIKFAIDEISNGFLNSWRREQEDEADLLGTDLMLKAGYNPEGMRRVLQRRIHYERDAKSKMDLLSNDFESAMKVKAERLDINGLYQTVIAFGIRAGLQALSDLREEIQKTHPDPVEREKNVVGYLGREYEDAPEAAVKKAQFLKFRDGPKVKPVLANHESATQAKVALNSKNNDLAGTLALAALSKPTADAPFPLRISSEVTAARGDFGQSTAMLERAARSDYASFSTVMALAGRYAHSGNYPRALATLSEAEARFSSPEAVLPTRIQVLMLSGDKEGAQAAYKACRQIKNGALNDQCAEQMGKAKCEGDNFLCALGGSFGDVGSAIEDLFGGSKPSKPSEAPADNP